SWPPGPIPSRGSVPVWGSSVSAIATGRTASKRPASGPWPCGLTATAPSSRSCAPAWTANPCPPNPPTASTPTTTTSAAPTTTNERRTGDVEPPDDRGALRPQAPRHGRRPGGTGRVGQPPGAVLRGTPRAARRPGTHRTGKPAAPALPQGGQAPQRRRRRGHRLPPPTQPGPPPHSQ